MVCGLWSLSSGFDWPHHGYDNARTRRSSEKIDLPLSVAWSAAAGTKIVSSPAVGHGFVVVGTTDRRIRAYSEADGTPVWEKTCSDEVIGSPLIHGMKVYVAVSDGTIRCMDLRTGDYLWFYDTGGNHTSSPVIQDDVLYLAAGFPERHLRALNPTTAATLWQVALDQVSYSSPAAETGFAYIADNNGVYRQVDTSTGLTVWSFDTPGEPALSSPLIYGSFVWALPGGEDNTLYRIHKNPAQWASQNASLAITDPTPPAPGAPYTLNKVLYAVSSPMPAGNEIVFVMRFDYHYDDPTDPDLYTDLIIMREFAVGVDRDAVSLTWQTLLGQKTVTSLNDIPAFSLCPTPARFESTAGDERIAANCTLSAYVRILDDTGTVIGAGPLDTPARSSPAIANARIFVGTENGTLYAFEGSGNSPPTAPTTGTPENNENVTDSTPLVRWGGATDPDGDPLTYVLRVDDGTTATEYSVPTDQYELPATPSDTLLTWSVRAVDDKGAMSPSSADRTFWVNRTASPPDPPSNFVAIPGDARIDLSWTGSASADLMEYRLSIRVGNGAWGAYFSVGTATSYALTGLANGTTYGVRLIAVDYDAWETTPLEVSATPMHPVSIDNVRYGSIAAALAAVSPGGAVDLGYGTFTLPATLELKQGVSLVGQAPHWTVIDGSGLDTLLRVIEGSGDPAMIRMLTLTGAGVAVDSNGRDVELWNLVVRGNEIGLLSASGSKATAVHVTFHQNAEHAIYAVGAITARNNILLDNGTGITSINSPIAPAVLSYNNAYGNSPDYHGVVPGRGATFNDVTFLDAPGGNYQVNTGQPTIDAADPNDPFDQEPAYNGNRANQGAYGNTIWAALSAALAPADDSDGGLCGLLGIEPLILLGILALVRRRRVRVRYNHTR